jgi:hypothetical protein
MRCRQARHRNVTHEVEYRILSFGPKNEMQNTSRRSSKLVSRRAVEFPAVQDTAYPGWHAVNGAQRRFAGTPECGRARKLDDSTRGRVSGSGVSVPRTTAIWRNTNRRLGILIVLILAMAGCTAKRRRRPRRHLLLRRDRDRRPSRIRRAKAAHPRPLHSVQRRRSHEPDRTRHHAGR